jgi:acyl-CoA synthetase (AMP-forming)/AMP-acid ligase II
LELLERERCSVYYGMANMARAMLEHPDRRRRRLDSMRTGLTIGLAEDIEMTMEAVGARELCNVYGSTETYGNCAVTDAHDRSLLRCARRGCPCPAWISAWWTRRRAGRAPRERWASYVWPVTSRRAISGRRSSPRRHSTVTAISSPAISGWSATTGGCASGAA